MKSITVKVLDDEDQIVVDNLVHLGLRRIVAEAVVYLDYVDETTAEEMAVATGRQQAQTSLALRDLRRRGWIHETRQYSRKPFKIRDGMYYKSSLTLTIPEIEEVLMRRLNAPIIG